MRCPGGALRRRLIAVWAAISTTSGLDMLIRARSHRFITLAW